MSVTSLPVPRFRPPLFHRALSTHSAVLSFVTMSLRGTVKQEIRRKLLGRHFGGGHSVKRMFQPKHILKRKLHRIINRW
ncbi:unnamed protein product [Agarophyton chilense]